jgi:hypothetical protein
LFCQDCTYLKIQVDKLIPAVAARVVHFVLPINPTDVRSVGIDRTLLATITVVFAGAVAPIQEPGFFSQVDILATLAALGTRKCPHR